MVYVELPDDKERRLSFYLAMEEFVARNIDSRDCFFQWQVEPSVIVGRNQLIETEVNLDYCASHNVAVYRRKSGGGCVYADKSNIMMSYITTDGAVNFTFNRYLNMLTLALYKLGLDAKSTGRNDILIDGRKISGNAFYMIPGRSIVHGTMLFDTMMENMLHAITPPKVKLTSKGVESVRQHIALLKDYLDISIDDFKRTVRGILCDDTVTLTPDDVRAIEEMEKEYLADEFIRGNNPACSMQCGGRVEGAGLINLHLDIKAGRIRKAWFTGDFLTGDEPLEYITSRLAGIAPAKDDVAQALPADTERAIRGLQKEKLLEILDL